MRWINLAVSAFCTLGAMVAHGAHAAAEQTRCGEEMQNKRVPHSVIDFARSRLVWKTKAGSRGYWRLIASASLISPTHQPLDQFVLAPAVMAGDVYGKGRLLKEPPYSFQIFASRQQHTVVREPGISIRLAVPADSTASNESVFEELAIHIAAANRNALDLDKLSDEAVSASWPLIANVELCRPNGDRWVLNFPVNHINIAAIDGKNAFQVETGPILIPHSLISPTSPASVMGGFAIGYVFFNQSDRIDLALWGPREINNVSSREFRHYERLDATVTLFGK
ncbi:MAG: hypothetical protein WAV72_14105 [Bradyrhizobium sp.]